MMVEDITGSETPAAYQEPSQGKSGFAAFASSKQGRIVLGAVGVFVLLAVVGVLVFAFVLQPGDDAQQEAMVPPAGAVPPNQGTVTQVSSEANPTEPETKPLSSTFTFRDIFEPTTNPATAPTGSSTTSGTASTTGDTDADDGGSSSADVPADTLLLKSVSTVDGEPVATFVWNGETYEAGEGDQLGDTPWKVVSIEGNTVVMLYGDSQVSLTVGQGVSK